MGMRKTQGEENGLSAGENVPRIKRAFKARGETEGSPGGLDGAEVH
jgi:hypothetical protein